MKTEQEDNVRSNSICFILTDCKLALQLVPSTSVPYINETPMQFQIFFGRHLFMGREAELPHSFLCIDILCSKQTFNFFYLT